MSVDAGRGQGIEEGLEDMGDAGQQVLAMRTQALVTGGHLEKPPTTEHPECTAEDNSSSNT